MAEAKLRQDWNHTSSILALMANVNRDSKKKSSFKPTDFHPMENKKKDSVIHDTRLGFQMLKKTFIKKRTK
jgi:hypothetical protein